MNIRKANMQDLDEILSIYNYARKFMRENGNPNQWKTTNPPRDVTEQDIQEEKLHVCVDENDEILGVFYFAKENDPSYDVIEEGTWLSDEPYAVAHRVASAPNTKGVGSFSLTWAFEQCGNLRIDTHEDNKPMQGLLKKLGFTYCGKIHLANGEPRIGFQKVREK